MSRRKIFENARIVDVINGSVYNGWFSVVNGRFEYVEEGNYSKNLASDVVDLSGEYVVPGLIDAHMHIESSLLTPRRFAEAVIPWGTCAVLQDPHEMANVFGRDGIDFMIRNSDHQPLKIYTAIPSCVPATRNKLETGNAKILAEDIHVLAKNKNVIALGEIMDYNSVLERNSEIMAIIEAAVEEGLSLEGHCPTLKGRKLSQYISCGIRSDHTLTNPDKIQEQLRKGLYVMFQRKSITERNINFVKKLKDRSRILLVTDDIPPSDLQKGHLNEVLNEAIRKGWNPIDAISSSTVRPAVYLGISNNLGSITPGKTASFFISKTLKALKPKNIFIEGECFSPDKIIPTSLVEKYINSLAIRKLKKTDFKIVDDQAICKYKLNVITANRKNTVTNLTKKVVKFKKGYPLINDMDLAQIAVFRRRSKEPTGAFCILKGLGMQCGAFATSFAHDSHNLVIVGKDFDSMARAANLVINVGGGISVVNGKHKAILELPIGGVITDAPISEVSAKIKEIEEILREMGVVHKSPLIFLTILSLSVSPYYKVSDLGIIDTERARMLSLII
ncbi:hypothetical protein CVT91_01090 [Candidatus Atribacteria bacterium HGW-Atribacteria-1]|nr:MAG: hypothetical protein CVT91_01090 [Candidatus Atribacteria bacterium HGW-Atribacteria-1]